MAFRFFTHPIISAFLRSLSRTEAAQALGVPTLTQMAAADQAVLDQALAAVAAVEPAGSELVEGPVRSTGGTSSIAANALTMSMVSNLINTLAGKADDSDLLPILSTTPPTDQVLFQGYAWEIDLSDVIVDFGGTAVFDMALSGIPDIGISLLSVQLTVDDYDAGLLGVPIAAAINSNEALNSDIEASVVEGSNLLRIALKNASETEPGSVSFQLSAGFGDGAVVFDAGPYEYTPTTIAEVDAVAGTTAAHRGQLLRAGSVEPYAWYVARTVNPSTWETLVTVDNASLLDPWLDAQRPGAILRTTAQGRPLDQVIGNGETYHIDLSALIIDVGGVAEFDVTTALSDTFTVTLLNTDVDNALVASKIAAVLNGNTGFAAVHEAEADGNLLIVRYRSNDPPGIPGYFALSVPGGSTLAFDGPSLYEWEDPVVLTATAAVAGTQATRIGAECRVGDAAPYRWFKAQTVTPTTWKEQVNYRTLLEELPYDFLGSSGTLANFLGENITVTHSDGTFTEWGCVQVEPARWLPRTPGVLLNRTTGVWERTFIADGTIQTEILPDQ